MRILILGDVRPFSGILCILGELDDDKRSSFRRSGNVKSTAEHLCPFLHSQNTERVECRQILGCDTGTVILNANDKFTARSFDDYFDLRGLGVLGNVRQRFLNYAKERS